MVLKRISLIILIITISLMIFTSCINKNVFNGEARFNLSDDDKTQSNQKSDNSEIQLWYYDYGNYTHYFKYVENLIESIKEFSKTKNIPLNVVKYDKKILTYKDYVIKRNLAAANGNVIIIEDAKYMWDLLTHNADYTKLESYNKLFDEYKNKFCIPIGVASYYFVIDPKILANYGLEIDKKIITYEEYLEKKQEMKEMGAIFRKNINEIDEIVDYYMNMYELSYINNTSEFLNDKDKFEAALKSCILEVFKDLHKYNNEDKLILNDIKEREIDNIYDENSNFYIYKSLGLRSLTDYLGYDDYYKLVSDGILVVSPNIYSQSPSFFMYKKITNERIWDLANFIVSEQSYSTVSGATHIFSPVLKGENIKETLELDENYKYKGPHKKAAEQGQEKSAIISKLVEEALVMTIENQETRDILSKYYFSNRDFYYDLNTFITESVFKLIENNLDYKDKKANQTLDDEINNFVSNFIIHNN